MDDESKPESREAWSKRAAPEANFVNIIMAVEVFLARQFAGGQLS